MTTIQMNEHEIDVVTTHHKTRSQQTEFRKGLRLRTCGFHRLDDDRRRAVVIVQVTVLLTVLLGFAAFTVDIGTLYRARAELQNAADAAALSAATAFSSDAMLLMHFDGSTQSQGIVLAEARRRATSVSHNNYTLGSPTQIEPEDFLTGWLDLTSGTSPIDTTVSFDEMNSVQVTARRYVGGLNGPVPYFFAPIFGRSYGETMAMAAASFDDRFAGLTLGPGGVALLPIIVADSAFDGTPEDVGGGENGSTDDGGRGGGKGKKTDRGGGGKKDRGGGSGGGGGTTGDTYYRDVYGFDEDTESVLLVSDGIDEIKILDDKMAPGNYGWLGIGEGLQGSFGLRTQIENGISIQDLEDEIGGPELTFVDDDGSPVTYEFGGAPGVHDTLVDGLALRIGEVVGIFTHSGVIRSGRNTKYQVSSIRFVRIMASDHRGGGLDGGVWVQPVTYRGNDVIVDSGAPSSNGNAGRVVLVR